MSDTITTATDQSWFSRLGAAIKGVVFGLFLFGAAFPLLFWNEGRSVKTYRALKEGAGLCVAAEANALNPATEGRLVHMTGTARTDETLRDDAFGVAVPNALRLVRSVEMYQWQEKSDSKTEKKLGGGTTTTTTTSYVKVWSGTPIDSTKFKEPAEHTNPAAIPVTAETKRAGTVMFGVHRLNSAQVELIPAATAVTPAPAATTKATVSAGYAYLGKDAAAPAVGDVRVSFKAAGATEISLVAAQKGEGFTGYTTENGRTLDLLKVGTFSAAQMFEAEQSANAGLTWFLRFLGFVVMAIGISLVLRPLSVFADVVPFLGGLVEFGLGLIATCVAGVLSLITIAVAWVVYRPLVGVGLLLVAGGIAYWVYRRRAAKAKAAAVAPAAPVAA